MTARQNSQKITFTAAERAEQRRIREMFREWHPSPEELIASGAGSDFALSGEYAGLRPFLVELKQAREEAGLSLADVSQRCGIDKAALSRLENGQNSNPTLDTLWRYAAAVGKRLLLKTADLASSARPRSKPKRATRG
jgi:DNA-binding XRE family transcriptional regulator